jgi:hypothetical protein
MQSKGDARGSAPLLAGAPVFDEFGLHSAECACARCQLGYGPTRIDRDQARRRAETAAVRVKAAIEAAKVKAKAAEKAAVTHELLKGDEAETMARLRASLAPVIRPATPEELAELKREYGLERKAHRR